MPPRVRPRPTGRVRRPPERVPAHRPEQQAEESEAFVTEAPAIARVRAGHFWPSDALGLQSTVGNAAVSRLVQRLIAPVRRLQRAVLPTPVNRPATAAIQAMTLQGFDDHARAQVDWFNLPGINDVDRRRLRTLLQFAARPSILSGCGEMTVSALLAARVVTAANTINAAVYRDLHDYSRAVSQSEGDTIQLQTPAPDPATAIQWGRAVRAIEGAGINRNLLSEGAVKQAEFERLISENRLNTFVQYVRRGARIEATNGMDVQSFLALCAEANPLSFFSSVLAGHIVNFHRFEAAALNQLITNFRQRNLPQARRKPLTLILHTARDHNGAFHRDPNLTAVIRNPDNLTLMIEGKETIAAVRSELPGLARAYGRNGAVDQVMIAGHGNTRGVELGARPGQDVDLDVNPVATNRLFDDLLRLIPNDPAHAPHRRIIFNACLTNSNSVTVPLSSDPTIAANEVRVHLGANSSIATYLRERARTRGLTNIDVRGANGSFGEVRLIDAGGGLDIISSTDPRLTSDKIDYVEGGTEPEGVLRAVLECWAGFGAPDPAARRTECERRMRARLAASASGWRPTIINTLFNIILARYWSNGEMIRRMADTAYALSEAEHDNECRVSLVADSGGLKPGGPMAAEANNIFTGVFPAAGPNYTKLVLNEVWMRTTSGRRAQFMSSLAPFNCQTAADYISASFVDPDLPQLLPSAGAATREQLLLAARVLDEDDTNASARAFLTRQVDTATRRFPPALGMGAILSGRPSENTILQKLGFLATATSSGSAASPDVHANLDLDSDGTNETYVEPLPGVQGRARRRTTMYERPDTSSTALARRVPGGGRLFMVGQSGDFYAVQNPFSARQTVFVAKANVNTAV